MANYTPMIQQYLNIKKEYQDAFLFFRLGDFYEMFFDDAKNAARELEITLTARDGGAAEKIPMCGVPHHAAEGYIQTLVEKGYKVAICEQVEDPRAAKGVVKREVVQVITPGTIMETERLSEKDNLYIAALTNASDDVFGLAYCDLTTGELYAMEIEGTNHDVVYEIASLQPREIVFYDEVDPDLVQKLQHTLNVAVSYEEASSITAEMAYLCSDLHEVHLIQAVAKLYQYFSQTKKRALTHLQPVIRVSSRTYLKMDYQTKRNLELVETIRTRDRKGSVAWLLDNTVTAMGGRLLKQWLEKPLVKPNQITARHNCVEAFINEYFLREELRENLKSVYDLERICGRISYGNANPKELEQLKRSLQRVPVLFNLLQDVDSEIFRSVITKLDGCESLAELLDSALVENPPIAIKDGDIIKPGYHELLDEYRFVRKNGKSWIAELEQREKEATGIKSLKIGYNRVFGYYIEITKANLSLLEEGRYERKQTLANAERFVSTELKEKEKMILEAEEKIAEIEYELFLEIRAKAKEYISRIQATAKAISELDVLLSFAKVSEEYGYVRPILSEQTEMEVIDGRHPVVERTLTSEQYVPNGIDVNQQDRMLLITGPNMAGKSTYMRQIALTAIINQVGCFVPAKSAKLPVFDQIFTRIGAADDLISGQSTFMVEMMESNHALRHATMQSLILLDEIGRGTSTYDGMALAQAMIEYIHDRIGAITLFSTHYHELTQLAETLPLLKNVHVSAHEEDGDLTFLHKIEEGAADKSYGIHVAKLADLPEDVLSRASELLISLENNASEVPQIRESVSFIQKEEPKTQLSLFGEGRNEEEVEILDELRVATIHNMTPIQALNFLDQIQQKLKQLK